MWLILTFVSAITNSLSRVLQKILLKDEQSDTFAFSFVFQLTVSLLFLIYSLLTNSFELPDLSGLGINIIVMMVFYSLGNLCVFKAFKQAEASEVSIVFASNTVWSVLAARMMLGEILSIQKIVGIALIILGIIAINYSRTNWKLNKGHLFALLGALLFGIAFTNDVYIISHYQSVPSYLVIAFALPGILTLTYSPKSIKNIKHFTKISVFKKLLVCCLFYALSALTIFTAYKMGGLASLISPIQQTSIIFTIVLSYFLLNEKDRLINKVVGTVCAFVGVLLLL